MNRRFCTCLYVLAGCLLISLAVAPRGAAYIEVPMSLGAVIQQSTNIVVMRVEKVDRTNNLIIYRKVRDLKGKHPTDVIKHAIGKRGFHPREWQYVMEWADVGKTAVFFHNGGASETCIGTYWYQAYHTGEWWSHSHGEPYLLRSFAGGTDKLISAVSAILAGNEVVVPCMVDGNKEDLALRRAKIQRLKASLKLLDYNAKRDFVGWGGEDFRRIEGMPGFTHLSALARVDPDAQAISALDIDGDGKIDLCLAGANRIVLLQNGGESLNELGLPLGGGCRAAVWADYNNDGKPDLLVATLNGPKLFTNLGKGQFRDDSHLLPSEPAYNLTAAAWIDYDGDGQTDILLGNGFHGLRLYRNKGKAAPGSTPLRLGDWHYIGPFDNSGGKGFFTAYPPEREIDLTKTYPGKGGTKAQWKKGNFKDGAVNNLALFEPQNNSDAVVYLYREIECRSAMELPISLGSDDTLTVWLNGEKLLAENVARAAAPDQNQAVLKLRPGKNDLLLKIGQGGGEWAFYFATKTVVPPEITWEFEDVSDRAGLGASMVPSLALQASTDRPSKPEAQAKGIGSDVKGDTLTVCDVDGDGRPDFLYGAGTGVLVRNTPEGFVEVKDSGIAYQAGKVGPVFGDFDGDGKPDLFVPQKNGGKLFRNLGDFRFEDVTAKAGDLSKITGQAVCAAWGDFDNDGHLDLVVGCLGRPNYFFRNRGDGTFEDASASIGLDRRIFNTQAVCLVDLNKNGCLDVVFNNEGQESVVLLGKKNDGKHIPVALNVAGKGVAGSQVVVLDKAGKFVAGQSVWGSEGRGGQAPPLARFVLPPGEYRVEVRYSNGVRREREISVADVPFHGVIDSK